MANAEIAACQSVCRSGDARSADHRSFRPIVGPDSQLKQVDGHDKVMDDIISANGTVFENAPPSCILDESRF
ncbi:hypothetical protein GB937_000858 [Aspergillus fischeri]|nr:hypothetical protein GB937_000858 [Aspergillus fischeri]